MTRDQHWTTADYVVVDVEGNGTRPPQLVELALLRVHQGHIGPVTTWLVRPPEPITWQAYQVHGIRDRDVADAPTIDDVAEDVLEVLGDSILVGHAVRVDVAVLRRALPGWTVPDTIDTLRLARRAFDLPSYSLSSLVQHRRLNVDLPLEMRPHRADYDVTVTARLLVDLATILAPDGMTREGLLRAGGPPQSAPADEAQPTLFDPFRPLATP